MHTTPANENDSVEELEPRAIDPVPVAAPRLEQVSGAVDDMSTAAAVDEEVAPVDASQD